MRQYICALMALLLFFACQTDSKSSYQIRSLLSHDFPIELQTPDSVLIKTEDWIVQKTVSVSNPVENYYLLISMAGTDQTDAAAVKMNLLNEIKAKPSFEKLISDEASGFVYSTTVDSLTTQHDFRHIQIIGDKSFVFQMDIQPKIYSLEMVEKMYEIAKQSK